MTPETIPNFPPLLAVKTTRVITKHFTNCAMYLPRDEFALLTWLIYQSKVDNSVEYSLHLIHQYSAAVKFSVAEYGGRPSSTSTQAIRSDFKRLVRLGYLLPTRDKKVFLINPMLSFRAEYVRSKDYEDIVKHYQMLRDCPLDLDRELLVFTAHYQSIVEEKLKKKRL